jgi:hypothetical protein
MEHIWSSSKMTAARGVPWWQRLLAAIAALIVTAVLVTSAFVLRDLKQDNDLHWGNGGEEEIVGYLLFGFAELLLPWIALVAAPFVLMIPARIQQKNWPSMIGVAALLPLLLGGILLRHGLSRIWHDIYNSPGIYLANEVAAIVCYGMYLLLLRSLGR